MNIVDSSGWLAYFADEPNAKYFLAPLRDTASLVVPTVTIYEVFKVVLRESSENEALQAAVAMRKGTVGCTSVGGIPKTPASSACAEQRRRETYTSNGRNEMAEQEHPPDALKRRARVILGVGRKTFKIRDDGKSVRGRKRS
jgi:hypothetical protein